jgi:RNA 2',3'-cyclic 3'-phosphodiesterase
LITANPASIDKDKQSPKIAVSRIPPTRLIRQAMPRLFVALDLPDVVKEQIAALCAWGLPGVTWVKPAQIHLSLRFIGEVAPSMVQRLQTALLKVRARELTLQLQGMGTFPPGKTPRVVWIGVGKNESLLQLRHKIEYQLTTVGLPGEGRKFHPHVTLGRVKSNKIQRMGDYLSHYDRFRTEPFAITDFCLYSSRLRPDGAIHTKEATFSLG